LSSTAAPSAAFSNGRAVEHGSAIWFGSTIEHRSRSFPDRSAHPDGYPVLDYSELTRDQAAALVEVTVEDFKDGRGDDARDVRRVKFKLAPTSALHWSISASTSDCSVSLRPVIGGMVNLTRLTGDELGHNDWQPPRRDVRLSLNLG
jgi:hypothetical protein